MRMCRLFITGDWWYPAPQPERQPQGYVMKNNRKGMTMEPHPDLCVVMHKCTEENRRNINREGSYGKNSPRTGVWWSELFRSTDVNDIRNLIDAEFRFIKSSVSVEFLEMEVEPFGGGGIKFTINESIPAYAADRLVEVLRGWVLRMEFDRKRDLEMVMKIESNYFRTQSDTGAGENALLIWNRVRKKIGLEPLTMQDLPAWDGKRYTSKTGWKPGQ